MSDATADKLRLGFGLTCIGLFFTPLAPYAVGLIMIVVASLSIPRVFQKRDMIRASLAWPSAKGQLTRVALETVGDGTAVNVSYLYRVQGCNYTSSNLGLLTAPMSVNDLYVKLDRIAAPGCARPFVTVYYDPQNPERAVLFRELDRAPIVLSQVLMLSLIALLGAFFVLAQFVSR